MSAAIDVRHCYGQIIWHITVSFYTFNSSHMYILDLRLPHRTSSAGFIRTCQCLTDKPNSLVDHLLSHLMTRRLVNDIFKRHSTVTKPPIGRDPLLEPIEEQLSAMIRHKLVHAARQIQNALTSQALGQEWPQYLLLAFRWLRQGSFAQWPS